MEETIVVSKGNQFKWRIIDDFREGRVSRREAATLLNTSEKSVQWLAKRCRKNGLKGLMHGNAEKKPHNAKRSEVRAICLELASRLYLDFHITHCLEIHRPTTARTMPLSAAQRLSQSRQHLLHEAPKKVQKRPNNLLRQRCLQNNEGHRRLVERQKYNAYRSV